MKVRDGLKFGIGWILAQGLLAFAVGMLDEKSDVRKNFDRAFNASFRATSGQNTDDTTSRLWQ